MNEIAFKVAPNSKLYENYFAQKEEKQKMHELAMKFFEKHNILSEGAYYQTEFLALGLTVEEKERFADQIKKHRDENGLYLFKKKSPMQQDWTNSVVSHVDLQKLRCTKFWYMNFIRFSGSHCLWNDGDDVYGMLKSDSDFGNLPDFIIPMKMSEYYSLVERLEGEK
jgi:hypothetical protein